MKRIAILGAGGMGTALALLFRETAAQVRLWSRAPEHASELAHSRINHRHLPGIRIPDDIVITAAPGEAMDGAELIVAAVPSSFLRAVLDRWPIGFPRAFLS